MTAGCLNEELDESPDCTLKSQSGKKGKLRGWEPFYKVCITREF